MRKSSVSDAVANVGLGLISCVISLVFAELFVRWFLPQYTPPGQLGISYNAQEGVSLGKPNSTFRHLSPAREFDVRLTYNALGFRDKADVRLSSDGDVFVVGDSFAFGHGLEPEKRFSDLLQERTGDRVFNIAIPGLDFDGYERLVRYAVRNGASISRLVITVCMENDLRIYGEQNISRNLETSDATRRYIRETKQALAKNLALFQMISVVVHSNASIAEFAKKLGLIEPYQPLNFDETVVKSSAQRLMRLAAQFKSLILIVPSRGLWMGDRRKDEDRIHTTFVEALQSSGLNVIDMRPIFESGGRPLDYHFAVDGHWNEKGHLAAASALIARVQQTAQQ